MRAQGALKVYVHLVRPLLAKYHTHIESLVDRELFPGAIAPMQACIEKLVKHLSLPNVRSTPLVCLRSQSHQRAWTLRRPKQFHDASPCYFDIETDQGSSRHACASCSIGPS